MSIRVGINGFGRIGRNVFRAGFGHKEIEFVAVNDLPVPLATHAYLLKHDSILGTFTRDVKTDGDSLNIDGKKLKVLNFKDPSQIPWADLGVDIVVESTGAFTDKEKAQVHITSGGAKKVIISAPAKNEDITLVMGVNHDKYDPAKHHVISGASCTTNCLAPVMRALLDRYGIVRGFMTTIHSYTNDQRLMDLGHKDFRRSRAAGLSMIPTSTGAAKAIGLVIPELMGKMDGVAIRVPTPNVSLVDLTCELAKDASKEDLNALFREYAEGKMKGILEYCTEPLVSKDFQNNPSSSIVDAELTKVLDKRLAKVFSWYDNEWGYSCRVVDLCAFIGKTLPVPAHR
jgi:glyceraldehyde 3-phosphate dehydrogenase